MVSYVIDIPMLLFEYEYRFTEYEYEENPWNKFSATIIPEDPPRLRCDIEGACQDPAMGLVQ
jgi:hypothetical protein